MMMEEIKDLNNAHTLFVQISENKINEYVFWQTEHGWHVFTIEHVGDEKREIGKTFLPNKLMNFMVSKSAEEKLKK